MNFTVSTKPFADALNLGVIDANISKYFQRSCLAQVTATKNQLKINLEAASITTEILLKGSGDVDETKIDFVDCKVLKQLVGTFDASVTSLNFVEGGIELQSGSSKFTLPRLIDSELVENAQLNVPSLPAEGAPKTKIEQSNWKFIKDHQMYAIAMSFVKPVYTKVWVGENGDVIVSDFDNSLFTHSTKSNLGRTCLLADTIINLFNSLPEGADITQLEDSYRIDLKTDGFEYAAEFKPKHEEDPDMGSYEAQGIMGLIDKDDSLKIKVNAAEFMKYLNQASLLARATDTDIRLSLHEGLLTLKDNNVDCKSKVETTCPDFEAGFKTDSFKSVLSNIDADEIYIAPKFDETNVVTGLTIWSSNMSIVLGSTEE